MALTFSLVLSLATPALSRYLDVAAPQTTLATVTSDGRNVPRITDAPRQKRAEKIAPNICGWYEDAGFDSGWSDADHATVTCFWNTDNHIVGTDFPPAETCLDHQTAREPGELACADDYPYCLTFLYGDGYSAFKCHDTADVTWTMAPTYSGMDTPIAFPLYSGSGGISTGTQYPAGYSSTTTTTSSSDSTSNTSDTSTPSTSTSTSTSSDPLPQTSPPTDSSANPPSSPSPAPIGAIVGGVIGGLVVVGAVICIVVFLLVRRRRNTNYTNTTPPPPPSASPPPETDGKPELDGKPATAINSRPDTATKPPTGTRPPTQHSELHAHSVQEMENQNQVAPPYSESVTYAEMWAPTAGPTSTQQDAQLAGSRVIYEAP